MPHTFDDNLIGLLVCPLTRVPLKREDDQLVAETTGLRYPIRDGIPVLLPDQAILPEGCESLEAFKKKHKDLIAE